MDLYEHGQVIYGHVEHPSFRHVVVQIRHAGEQEMDTGTNRELTRG